MMTPEQLKNSILQLAIEGKLVPQIAGEGTGAELLEKIRTPQSQQVATAPLTGGKKSTKSKQKTSQLGEVANEVSQRGFPFAIPKTWAWCRLGEVFRIVSSRRVMQSDWQMRGVPFYRAREIAILADQGMVDNELFISEDLFRKLSQNGVPKVGDLMVSAVGTLGKTYIVKKEDRFYYKDASVICLENRFSLNSCFYKYVMMSEFMRKQILSNSAGTTVGTLTISRMNEYQIPLPPLAEQKRIVAKLEELLPLCEELK